MVPKFVVRATNCGATVYCLQVPECHPDNVSAHSAIPYNCCHHQQRCTKAQASAQGLGQSHSTGKASNNNSDLMGLKYLANT